MLPIKMCYRHNLDRSFIKYVHYYVIFGHLGEAEQTLKQSHILSPDKVVMANMLANNSLFSDLDTKLH